MTRHQMVVSALLVVALAACAPDSSDALQVGVELADDHITLDTDTAAFGPISFVTTNVSSDLVHEIEVFADATAATILPVDDSVADTTGLTLVSEIEDVLPGGRATLTTDLAPGTYLVICNLPGHYEQGMWAYLEVTPSDA